MNKEELEAPVKEEAKGILYLLAFDVACKS